MLLNYLQKEEEGNLELKDERPSPYEGDQEKVRHKFACSEERGTILLKVDTLNSYIFYRTGLSSIYST